MLKDNEKEHIRLEEAYRQEVRNQLPPPAKNGVLSFLNSNLGIWLLSVVCISVGGSLYTKWQAVRESAEKERLIAEQKNHETRARIERLDLEIGYRFSQLQVRLYSHLLSNDARLGAERFKTNLDLFSSVNDQIATRIRQTLLDVCKSPGSEFNYLFPEYSDFGLPALVAELRRHVESKEEKDELNQTLKHLTGLNVFLDVRHVDFNEPGKIAAALIASSKVGNNQFEPLVLPRWKNSHWYFLDGNFQNPFP